MQIQYDLIPAELRTKLDNALSDEAIAEAAWEDSDCDEGYYSDWMEKIAARGYVWKEIAENLMTRMATPKYEGYEAWLETLSEPQRFRVKFAVERIRRITTENAEYSAANEREKLEKSSRSLGHFYTGLAVSLVYILGIQDCLPVWDALETEFDKVLKS